MGIKTVKHKSNVLGYNLWAHRKKSGLTQEQAANLIGATRTTMVAIEQGKRAVTETELDTLAAAYGLDDTLKRNLFENRNSDFYEATILINKAIDLLNNGGSAKRLNQRDRSLLNPIIDHLTSVKGILEIIQRMEVVDNAD